ncbi:TRAF3-interacting protein 1 [Chytridiales sp. JEL 0842]|nr:TRAF3-interacting protein 1 [Chytridiales sp. JEL 0842]
MPDAKDLDESIKKTIDILSRIIKKPPLTAKLLSKPPFRYLHDLFSEVIKATGFASGLYDDHEMNSENVKDKEAKIAYLLKMIDLLGIATGVDVKANPLKIVAGMEPEETNALLQLLGKAVLKKVSTSDAVKRVRAGEHQNQKKSSSSSKEKEKAQPPPSKAVAADHKDKDDKPRERERQPSKQPPPSSKERHASPPPNEKSMKRSLSKEDIPKKKEGGGHSRSTSNQPPKQQQHEGSIQDLSNEDVHDRDHRDSRNNNDSSAEDLNNPPRPSSPPSEPEPQNQARIGMVPTSTKRHERPTTARPAPPRVRQAEFKAVEEPAIAPAIIQDTGRAEDDDDHEYIVFNADGAQPNVNGEDDAEGDEGGQHGGLVQKILDTKSKLSSQNPPRESSPPSKSDKKGDKSAAKREIESLRESIQVLCRSTNPLAKTMDYLQEDVDSMNKELEMWKKEGKREAAALEMERKETQEALQPLEEKLKDIDNGIEDLLERISSYKAGIIQNEKTLQKLLRNVAQPAK